MRQSTYSGILSRRMTHFRTGTWPGWGRLGLVVAALLTTGRHAPASIIAPRSQCPNGFCTSDTCRHEMAAKSRAAGALLTGAGRSRVNWNSPVRSLASLPPEPAALAALPAVSGPRKQGLGVSVGLSPDTIAHDYAGFVQLSISGLDRGETVRVEKFLVYSADRTIDKDALMVQSFSLTDGQATAIGGRANINVPSDLTPVDGTIAARLNYVDLYATHVVGQYVCRVSSPAGHFPAASAAFTVTNAPWDQSFSGRVLAGGQSVSNAVVVLLDSSGGGYDFVAGTAADAAGRYTLGADPGYYHLVAIKPGLIGRLAADTERELEDGADTTVDLELSLPTRTISGQVTDNSQPPVNLPGIQLYLHSNEGHFTVAYSDANGRFEVPVAASQWQVEVPANAAHEAGCLVPQRPPTADTRTNNATGLQLTLAKATGLLCGYVTNLSGAPIAGVEVFCFPDDYSDIAFGITDTNGYYVAAISPGNWWVNLSSRSLDDQGYLGQLDRSTSVETNQAAGISFAVKPANATLAGSVMDEQGEPLESVAIESISDQGEYAETETDADGAFTLRATGGLWTIFVLGDAWASDFLYQSLNDVVLSDGGAKNDLAFVSPWADFILEVQITDNLGQPVTDLYVGASSEDGGPRIWSESYTYEDGSTWLDVFPGQWTLTFDTDELKQRGYRVPASPRVTVGDDDAALSLVLEVDSLPVTPPQLRAVRTSQGQFQMTVAGDAGAGYVIQSSADLLQWSNLATNMAAADGKFTYAEGASLARRFYRVQKQ